MANTPPPRVGISQCLLGEPVRYDGGHKRDGFLVDTLSRLVEWVPVCPEVEAGLGTPREAMRLVGKPQASRLLTISSGLDHTRLLARFSERRVHELEALNLSGFIFKAGSPSCGIGGVPLFSTQGIETQDGVGLFACAFMERFPDMPVEQESRLHDPQTLKDFLERVLSYRRSRDKA